MGRRKVFRRQCFALSKGWDECCVCRGHGHPTVPDDAHCRRALLCAPLGHLRRPPSKVSRAEVAAALGLGSVRSGESVSCLWSERQPGAVSRDRPALDRVSCM